MSLSMLTDGKTLPDEDEPEDLLQGAPTYDVCDRQTGTRFIDVNKENRILIPALCLVLLNALNSTQLLNADTTQTHVISEVTVQGELRHHETIAPQKIGGALLQRVSAHSVADALRLMSGVQVKDYGGIGGLKTVNIRSMGSQHVGVYYDGVELGNAQNGQIDLGQFSLDNIEEISVYNGQRSALLQTASDLTNAGSVYIRTKAPLLSSDHPSHKMAKLQTGASQLLRGSLRWDQRLTDHWLLSANVEGMASDGRYHFNYRRLNYDGTLAYDTTAVRHNGDLQSIRAEANLWYRGNHNEVAHIKAYTYHSNRGIPGAIVNNVWRRGERQGDNNTFVQGQWQKDISDRYALRVLGKYAYYGTHYINKDESSLQIDQRYRQQEAYASMSHLFAITSWWNVAASYDVRYNTLWSDKALFASPSRWSHLLGLATAFDWRWLQMHGSLVYSHFSDDKKSESLNVISKSTSHLTPALFLNVSPFSHNSLQLHAFVKQSFRMPTFNDLYYTEIGNANLRPEKATQSTLGVKYKWLTIDAYHNVVDDKIVAYPKGQQFRWTMLNLGHVVIDGIDVQASDEWQLTQDLKLFAHLQYTYQQARDKTDKSDSYYGDQIPYTPWHSGSATGSLEWRDWSLTYNFVYTGERYCQQENIAYNHLQPWYTSDLSLVGRFHLGATQLQATLQVNNLFNQQYDVIINYPMPGRQLFATIVINI